MEKIQIPVELSLKARLKAAAQLQRLTMGKLVVIYLLHGLNEHDKLQRAKKGGGK